MVQRLPMFARAGGPWWLGDGPAAGPVLEPEGGQAGEVDHAGSGEDVGEDAGLASAAGFAPAPRPPGEVADLAFHDGPVGAVGLLPVRVALAGLVVWHGISVTYSSVVRRPVRGRRCRGAAMRSRRAFRSVLVNFHSKVWRSVRSVAGSRAGGGLGVARSGKSLGVSDFTLDDGEVDLHLIKPGRVDGQVDQPQVGPGSSSRSTAAWPRWEEPLSTTQ